MEALRLFAALSTATVALVCGQTVYLAGDSTTARGNTVIDGWGQYMGQYFNIPVVNRAIGGRSSRSFTEEDRFQSIANEAKTGDFVVIEFGHNDGSAGAVDNGRQVAVGDSYDTTATVTTSSGASIVIHTYNYYIQNAVNLFKSKGLNVIVASPTPRNSWTNGAISPGPRFVGYAQLAASRTGVTFLDHYTFTAKRYQTLGQSTVNTFYPNDALHTSPTGAEHVAQAFVKGLACGGSPLSQKLNNARWQVSGSC